MVKLAMAWCMSHPDVTSVLVGARETRHIDNGIEALATGLDPELRAEMSAWNEPSDGAAGYF
jgi:aryl-alcohol dehydrogenase-like predicted oxidoreductase